MKIGLFGGTFDPIHNGHLEIARLAKEKMALDRLLFIPAGVSPFKQDSTADKAHRLAMCRLAAGAEFEVSPYEIEKQGVSYTYETLLHFQSICPGDTFYFIMGDDAYASLPGWKNGEKLLKMCNFIVFSRQNKAVLPPAVSITIPPIPISSTQVRERVAAGAPINHLVPPAVADYIKNHKLYQEQ